MAEVETNLQVWTEDWDWSRNGDEWSDWWGGTEAMWFGALLPRIHAHLPAGTILEIAPGHGRWTQYLKERCEKLVAVDLSPNCIEACRRRFADSDNIELHVNDGRTLDAVADASIDFAFSFDSLVHVEADVIESYLAELRRVLTAEGVAFIHHSNIGTYRRSRRLARAVPARLLRPLTDRGILIDLFAWRGETMTAERFRAQAAAVGLSCISQEIISWDKGRYMIDAISVVTPEGSAAARPTRTVRNPFFSDEGRRMRELYAAR